LAHRAGADMIERTQPQPSASVNELNSLRVAVLEDEPALRDRIILPGLARYGFAVTGYGSVAEFCAAVAGAPFDLLVLDVSLPDGDGFSVARQMREHQPALGIIMLTSRAEVTDRIRGLTEGADVYFSKPIEMDLLAAALHSLARRIATTAPSARPPAVAWRLSDDGWGLLAPEGTSAALTRSERSLCAALFERPGELVSRELLIEAIAGNADDFDAHRLDAMVYRLRSKVRRRCGADLPLTVVHGRGYMLDPAGRVAG